MKISATFFFIIVFIIVSACQAEPSPEPTATPTQVQVRLITNTPTAPPRPTETQTPEPTASPVVEATATLVPTTSSPSATPAPLTPTSTASPTPSPTPTETEPVSISDPLPTASLKTPVPVGSAQGEMTIGLIGSPAGLNPLQHTGALNSQLNPLLYYTLNQLNSITAQPLAGLAKQSQISADGLSVSYNLVDSAIGPADVEASLNAAEWLNQTAIESILAAETGLQLKLIEVNCALIDALGQTPILPQADLQADIPGNSGPYQVESWDENGGILRLKANALNPALYPQIEAITVRFFADEAEALAALQAGEIDLLPLSAQPLNIPAGYRLIPYEGPVTTQLIFNNQDDILQRGDVRQALSAALNRAQIVEQAFGDSGQIANGLWPETHWAAMPASAPLYDPALAQTLLNEAGIQDTNGDGWRELPGNSEPWEIVIRVDREKRAEQSIGWLAAEAYRNIGLKASAQSVPFSFLIGDLLAGDYQVAVYSLPVMPQLNQTRHWHSEQIEAEYKLNLPGYANAQVDAWLKEANQLAGCNAQQRAEIYQDIQTQLSQDSPVNWLARPTYYLLARDNIQGLAPGPFAPFTWNVRDWAVAE